MTCALPPTGWMNTCNYITDDCSDAPWLQTAYNVVPLGCNDSKIFCRKPNDNSRLYVDNYSDSSCPKQSYQGNGTGPFLECRYLALNKIKDLNAYPLCTAPSSGTSMPIWGWILIGLVVVVVMIGVGIILFSDKKKISRGGRHYTPTY